MNTKTKVKDCTITIRCTYADKQKIMKNAVKENISISEYALEAAITGRRSFRYKKKRLMCHLVEWQEEINGIYEEIQNGKDLFSKEEVISVVNKVERGVMELWQI